MKEMVYLSMAFELVLDKLADDGVTLFNVPITCLEEGSESVVKEAIRDSLGGEVVNSDERFMAFIYFVDESKEPQRVISRWRPGLIKGSNIAQWAMNSLPMRYGVFAIMLRSEKELHTSNKHVWMFIKR